MNQSDSVTTHQVFDAAKWAELRGKSELSLSDSDLVKLRGVNDEITVEEVSEIYVPAARLIALHLETSNSLHSASDDFLGVATAKVPFIVGIAGSVAVGKSTGARVLKQLLTQLPGSPGVELVTTDGFLYPNRILIERKILDRKGFPESYDRRTLLKFLYDIKSGEPNVRAPVYSHLFYDIIQDEYLEIDQPDILIVEGLNVLQTGSTDQSEQLFVSDFFDFSIFMDAETSDLRDWYVERFLTLKETAFTEPGSYFSRYTELTTEQAQKKAIEIWTNINELNLTENILPTRERADLILTKRESHKVSKVKLRKL